MQSSLVEPVSIIFHFYNKSENKNFLSSAWFTLSPPRHWRQITILSLCGGGKKVEVINLALFKTEKNMEKFFPLPWIDGRTLARLP